MNDIFNKPFISLAGKFTFVFDSKIVCIVNNCFKTND